MAYVNTLGIKLSSNCVLGIQHAAPRWSLVQVAMPAQSSGGVPEGGQALRRYSYTVIAGEPPA